MQKRTPEKASPITEFLVRVCPSDPMGVWCAMVMGSCFMLIMGIILIGVLKYEMNEISCVGVSGWVGNNIDFR